ncbi:PspC domain-containing protein [Actinomadura flavalba]|uniref:PspC domain-containing protein n=1 Tax=Actinomadura flavalba TaxID=1120938 RepID=UPI00036BCF3C|nr:PspC domain-containing protein [Actinomadura flavalba]
MNFDKNDTAAPDLTPAETPQYTFRRAKDGRLLAGVGRAVADQFNVDVNLVRLGIVVLALFTGFGFLAYGAAWLLIPLQGAQTSIAEDLIARAKADPKVQDAVQKAKEAVS